MRLLLRSLLPMLLVLTCAGRAQSKADEAALQQIPQAFASAWAQHDGHQLGKIMAPDVDFVNVGADWVHGRSDFELFHQRLLSGRFHESTLTPLQVRVRFLRPDLAVLHWSWKVVGDQNQDRTARKPRFGMFTMVAEKRKGEWLIVVAQNTNWMPVPPPDLELKGITPPIMFPGEGEKQ